MSVSPSLGVLWRAWQLLILLLQQSMRIGQTEGFVVEAPHGSTPYIPTSLSAGDENTLEQEIMERERKNLNDLVVKTNALFRERCEASWCPVWVEPRISIDKEYGLLDRELTLYSSLRVEDVGVKGLKCGSFTSDLGEDMEELKHGSCCSDFDFGSYDGYIPSELGLLTSELKLIYCGHGHSNHDVFLPTELFNLQALSWLNFEDIQLPGEIPTELGLMTSLTDLGFRDCSLQGTLPTELGLLTNLEELCFANNTLVGTIPTEFGQLTKLDYLHLADNILTGSIPSELGRLTKLANLYLYGNHFTGTLPSEVLGLLVLSDTRHRDEIYWTDVFPWLNV